MAARTRSMLRIAGALASAMLAFAVPASGQLPPILTTTTTSATSSTTTTTEAPTTTTTEAAASTTTTGGVSTTTEAPTTTTTVETTPTSSGGVSITAPNEVTLSSASIADGETSGSLGSVSVSDTRGALAGGWTVKVSSTAFTTGSSGPAETIDASNVYYWSGVATSTSGAGLFTPGQPTALAAQSLSTMRTAYTAAATGSSSATWTPTVEIRFPDGVVAGEYQGAIVHSVA